MMSDRSRGHLVVINVNKLTLEMLSGSSPKFISILIATIVTLQTVKVDFRITRIKNSYQPNEVKISI